MGSDLTYPKGFMSKQNVAVTRDIRLVYRRCHHWAGMSEMAIVKKPQEFITIFKTFRWDPINARITYKSQNGVSKCVMIISPFAV